jgi:septum formation protein
LTKITNLLLASSSPQRRRLLEQIGASFNVIDPGDVEKSNAVDPKERVSKNALYKVFSVIDNLREGIVIGADTLVFIDGSFFGKPKDDLEAYSMLKTLMGKTHDIYTGVAIYDVISKKSRVFSERTIVHIKHLSEDELQGYVSSGEPMDKAGGYAIQGLGALLVKGIEGCYNNVVGLPLSTLGEVLREFSINLLVKG